MAKHRRRIPTELSCEKCESPFTIDVEVEVVRDETIDRYAHRSPATEFSGLVVDRAYPGTAERYCPTCLRLWRADEQAARFEALAELGNGDGLVARWTPPDAILKPKALSAIGAQRAAEVREHVRDPRNDLGLGELYLIWKGRPAVPGNQAFTELEQEVLTRCDRALLAKGWTTGSSRYRDNVSVSVSESGAFSGSSS